MEKENKRIYETKIQYDPITKAPKCKVSSIKEYGITLADATITDVDYEEKVDMMLSKKIDAATKASVSKQELMTAQQQALTAKAKGEQALVEIKYTQKQEQTRQEAEAETKVMIAEQDKIQQKIAYEGAVLEAKKIKELAGAEAYSKARVMQTDGALDKKLNAYTEVQKSWVSVFAAYQGQVAPTYMMGGGTGGGYNAAHNFMEIMKLKAAKDLNLQLQNK